MVVEEGIIPQFQVDISKRPDVFSDPQIEIDGHHVEVVCSNVRARNIPWGQTHLVSGKGQEVNLVLVEALSGIGSTTHVENLHGIDEPIHTGEKFIVVLANRNSGTSESGGIPKSLFGKFKYS